MEELYRSRVWKMKRQHSRSKYLQAELLINQTTQHLMSKKRFGKFLAPALVITALLINFATSKAQETQIRGFAEVLTGYIDTTDKVSFGLGEQDLFITSELTDRISFLGETVFKFSPSSPTLFDISIERIVVKYNIAGNNNILVGKHH